jgi:Niemann-Pick C1 protein
MRQDKPVGIEEEKMNTNGLNHVSEEDESETSIGDEQTGWLDRLGIQMDDGLRRIFTAYVFQLFSSFMSCFLSFRIGLFCAYNPKYTIVPVLVIICALCFGSRYYTVTTDPVDLWVASNSRARMEKAFFDEKFG